MGRVFRVKDFQTDLNIQKELDNFVWYRLGREHQVVTIQTPISIVYNSKKKTLFALQNIKLTNTEAPVPRTKMSGRGRDTFTSVKAAGHKSVHASIFQRVEYVGMMSTLPFTRTPLIVNVVGPSPSITLRWPVSGAFRDIPKESNGDVGGFEVLNMFLKELFMRADFADFSCDVPCSEDPWDAIVECTVADGCCAYRRWCINVRRAVGNIRRRADMI